VPVHFHYETTTHKDYDMKRFTLLAAASLALLSGSAIAQLSPPSELGVMHPVPMEFRDMAGARAVPQIPIAITLDVHEKDGSFTAIGATTANNKWVYSHGVDHSLVSPIDPGVGNSGSVLSSGKDGALTLYATSYRTGLDVIAGTGSFDSHGNVLVDLDVSDAILRSLKNKTYKGMSYEEPDVVRPHLKTKVLMSLGKSQTFTLACDGDADCVSITVRLASVRDDGTPVGAASLGDLPVNGSVAVNLSHEGDPCEPGSLHTTDLGARLYVGLCKDGKIVAAGTSNKS
jgi:hypothetical protein